MKFLVLLIFVAFVKCEEPISCTINPYEDLVTCYVENRNISEADQFVIGERDRKGNLVQNIDGSKVQRVELRKSNVPVFPIGIFSSFPNLERFYCRGNMEIMEPGTFKDKGRLEQLNMNENSLTVLKAKNFEGAENMLDLRLGSNKIETVDEAAFQGLTKLIFLRLAENKISILATNTFATNTALEKIDLAENHLTTLPAEIFKNNLNLKKINLAENKISLLINTMFSHLKVLESLDLDDNDCIDGGFDSDDSDEQNEKNFVLKIEEGLKKCSPK